MIRNFNFPLFIRIIVILGILSFISYFGSFAKSEGADSIIYEVLNILFIILSFPMLFLVSYFKIMISPVYLISVCLNIIMYGFIIERMNHFNKISQKN